MLGLVFIGAGLRVNAVRLGAVRGCGDACFLVRGLLKYLHIGLIEDDIY